MSEILILPLGPDGVIVRFADTLSEAANRATLAFQARVEQLSLDAVLETAPSLTSVYVRFCPTQMSRQALTEHLNALLAERNWLEAELPTGRKIWHVPAVFEGEAAVDLEEVAGLVGIDPEVAVQQVTGQNLRVLALGFAPGQPYLGFLPERWNIPRRSEITPQVPRGAVVVAVQQVIPFANPAPTGWWQIGRTGFRCYNANAVPTLPLSAGDEVRFQSVPAAQWQKLEADSRGCADVEELA